MQQQRVTKPRHRPRPQTADGPVNSPRPPDLSRVDQTLDRIDDALEGMSDVRR